MNPRILQILIAILALGILGFGAYQTFRVLYKPAPAPKTISLNDYLTTANTSVSLTLKGPVTAPEKHVEQTFTITNSQRSITIYKAYSESPAFTETYENNQTAYEDFMRALQNAGFTGGATSTSKTTEVGDCPSGTRAVYELRVESANVFRTWSSSCDHGTFTGSSGSIRTLFQNQIPIATKLPADLRL